MTSDQPVDLYIKKHQNLCNLCKGPPARHWLQLAQPGPGAHRGQARAAAGKRSLPEAVFRFIAHTLGMHVLLSGSLNSEHMRANAAALNKGPLPAEVESQLVEWFREMRLEF